MLSNSTKSTLKPLEYAILISSLAFTSIAVISIGGSLGPLFLLGFAAVPFIIFLSTRYNGAYIILYLLITITFLDDDEGIQLIEMPFFLSSVLLCLYFGLQLIKGSLQLKNVLDKAYLLFILLLGFSLVFGIMNGANIYKSLGEFTLFFGWFLYFPLRKYLDNGKFRTILFWTLGIIVAYVLIRNILNYRAILIQAVLPWQAEKARVAANELILLIGAVFSMSYAAIVTSRFKQIISTLLFLALVGGLVMTQSRGYWIAFAFSALSIFVVINKSGKLRILYTFIFISSVSLLFASLFFSDLLDLVITGIVNRFQSIGSGKLDISLLERVLESQKVLQKIILNPVMGYGLGVEFTKKILFYDYFIPTSYVHLGYLATWYKFGIFGLLLNLYIWIYTLIKSAQLYKITKNPIYKTLLLTIVGSMAGIVLVNITSPQILTFEGNLFIAVFGAFISYLYGAKSES
ncbi:MAG: O-antigen ligase family protein [Balneolaceae bacterium]|nr:O-antigen ligase family protein [Balneolaceae bacterium]MBO6545290.1 O-antigen ligase family protein [Balneolaceae bacterium]MBO6646686.1 O-antigen ligase family protein [Balneolaceae bacterium]